MLVDHADPRGTGGVRICCGQRLALDADYAAVGVLDPGDDLHEGRLAGPVLTQKPPDFARLDGEGHFVAREDGTETLGDALDLEHGFHGPHPRQREGTAQTGRPRSCRETCSLVSCRRSGP